MTIDNVVEWITTDRIGAVGDIGTALAFGLAAVIYGHDRRDKRRAQAEQVSAWFAYDAPIWTAEDERWQLHLRNASVRPVYDVLAMPARGVCEHVSWTVLAPESVEHVPVGGNISAGLEEMTNGGGVTIDFTDAAGRRWRRTPDGRLHRWRRWHGRPTNPDNRRAYRAAERGEPYTGE